MWVCVIGETSPRTFVPSVVLLVGGAGWQVLRDGHGLFCLLGCFIGRGAFPAWGDTHQQAPIIHRVNPLTCSHSGEAKLGVRAVCVCVCLCVGGGLLYVLFTLYSSIMRRVVFYLASGPFPGPPLSPCGASTLMGERDEDVEVYKFNQVHAEETTL